MSVAEEDAMIQEYIEPNPSVPGPADVRLRRDAVPVWALVNYWRQLGQPQYDGQDLQDVEDLGKPAEPSADEMYERAVELAQQTRRISVSLLQRRLGIGYPRAARLVDLLEERGIIAAAEDGRTREVLVQGELTPPDED